MSNTTHVYEQPCWTFVYTAKVRYQQAADRAVELCKLLINHVSAGPTIRKDLCLWVTEKQKLLSESVTLASEHFLFLTQGFGEGFDDALYLKVSRFEAKPADRTAYFWTDPSGKPRSLEMPPYFIADLEAARQQLREFTKRVRSVYIETLITDSNPIVQQTFQAALLFTAFGEVSHQLFPPNEAS